MKLRLLILAIDVTSTATFAAEPSIEIDKAVSETAASTTDVRSPSAGAETGIDEVVSEVAEAQTATHVVNVSVVNARHKPGKQGRVLAVVPEGQELVQLDQRGSWGQFKLLGGENDGLKVWIYDRLIISAN